VRGSLVDREGQERGRLDVPLFARAGDDRRAAEGTGSCVDVFVETELGGAVVALDDGPLLRRRRRLERRERFGER